MKPGDEGFRAAWDREVQMLFEYAVEPNRGEGAQGKRGKGW